MVKSGCCRVVVPGCCKVVEQMVADGDRGRPRVAGGVAGRWRCRSRTKNSIAVGRTIVSGRRLAGEKEKGRTFCSTFSVELPGLEPGKTGPESVVLPLHHSSIPCGTPRSTPPSDCRTLRTSGPPSVLFSDEPSFHPSVLAVIPTGIRGSNRLVMQK